MQILNIQITLLYASNYFLGSSLAYMESLNDLITNLIFNFSHIVFVGSISNSTEGEVVEATKFAKHATKEHLEKQLKDLNKQFATWKPHNHNLVA
jgi:NADP-dependent 3-hydroxy acid dehydrogenase YdfG